MRRLTKKNKILGHIKSYMYMTKKIIEAYLKKHFEHESKIFHLTVFSILIIKLRVGRTRNVCDDLTLMN